ncbi:autophagy-related protein 27 [Desarmillaria tabescens]|uniref:Autophagy-related protein 27 n=1 Tax=Armillaria tabescens TaxID=1929756 RepID=A0AA39N8N7_ARMTA|nr:autophagy-related protein 27 [Desarmillaria tabescens]KAK0461077.1 autophagy-related protein 27 [Desarmillaria tabescens]
MILRRQWLSSLAFFFFYHTHIASVLADDELDCHITVSPSVKFDLTSLGGEHTVSRRRDTPPTTMVDSVRLDLCSELSSQGGVNERDQCPSHTRVCLTKTNEKEDADDRIISVIPIVQTSTANPSYKALSSPKGLSVIMHGPSYTSGSVTQSFNLTLLCDPDASNSDPTFTSYDEAELRLEWRSPAGCSFGENNGGGGGSTGPGDGPVEESVGSGLGWFFLVLLLAFLAYFGLGAYYNYTTYGASGKDLIPHRDFWQEVPYMLSDVASHLCSSVRPRRSSSRGGYIAV